MKNRFIVGASALTLVVTNAPAHAKGGGAIGTVIDVIGYAIDGTIPLPYILGFLALVLAIVVLGAIEYRKNANKAAEEETTRPTPVNLDK